MSKQLIECVPNFSEGRNPEVIEALVDPFRKRAGCYVFDYRADRDHNRLVISLVGEVGPVQEALIESAKIAAEAIDMATHSGGHPRIGAVDVIPFVPVSGIAMEDCVEIARGFGKRFYRETGIPVYYYEEAAMIPERKRLEAIRKGQYEALKTDISQPHRCPDVGKPELHPTAGATVVGARKFLIAFNVNLGTADSGGGLGHVKGIGLSLEERGMVQVSVNIVDHEKNPLYRVLELIRIEARRWGVEVVETEVYGMVPAAALLGSAEYYMNIAQFDLKQVIELRLLELMDTPS